MIIPIMAKVVLLLSTGFICTQQNCTELKKEKG
jgi:hypothetical protein